MCGWCQASEKSDWTILERKRKNKDRTSLWKKETILWKREKGETMFENSTKKADKDWTILKRKKEKIELYIGRKK